MKILNLLLFAALIFIFAGGYFAGSYIQYDKDAELINTYMENGTEQNPSCIPCECYSPDPYRYVTFKEPEPLKAVTIKGEVRN